MVNKYVLALIATLIVVGIMGVTVWNLEQSRLNKMNGNINELITKSEDTKLMLLYLENAKDEEREKYCNLLDLAIKKQMDEGYELVKKMKSYEEASLITNYEITRKRYILNNIQLWIYTNMEKKYCRNNNDIILFFYTAKTPCQKCSVQGEVLDKIREKCSSVRIYSIAYDEDLGMIKLLKEKYDINSVPSIVINNITINKLVGEEEILKKINCY